MPELKLYAHYDRRSVHSIFSPYTNFTPQAGTWGLQGIIAIPDRPGDFVFFVTFGQAQGDHVFDEGITRDGVLTWQSQPQQTLKSDVIRKLIAHDETKNTIHLFLRTSERRSYTYLGRLKYLSHDASREKPVYFQWQLLDWDLDQVPLTEMGLELSDPDQLVGESDAEKSTDSPPTPKGLTETAPPAAQKSRAGLEKSKFRTRKKPDYAAQDARNRRLGYEAEIAVLAKEQQNLLEAGRHDLAERVRHVAAIEGDGAGYDILSWTIDGEPRYIEVKATRGGIDSEFYMSRNEAAFSAQNSSHYHLIRVFDFDPNTHDGHYFELSGDINEKSTLEPLEYRVRVGQKYE
ncbi:DUF3427 domain-containing protein [Halorhodospira neutriphila]|uniref:Protein NO VEIN C-terminal domain-containing protein n=1 Tax=Halorhodospira neutriphila TaxID=168379 RepID=A0ABS1E4N9_9GAMM|nr:DUF3427 domain-containing protein [Halorhodospira neutriphila]MBK1726720.1 hypothetical protein [Halorhodospira neutriphila]